MRHFPGWQLMPVPASSGLFFESHQFFFTDDGEVLICGLPLQLLHTRISPAINFSNRLGAKSFAGMNDSEGEGGRFRICPLSKTVLCGRVGRWLSLQALPQAFTTPAVELELKRTQHPSAQITWVSHN